MTNCLRLMAFLLLAGCQQPLRSEDEWLGKRVFWKDSAVVMNGTEVIDKYKVLSLPAEVKEVKGDLLRLGRYWISKTECMQLNEAIDFYVEEIRKNPRSTRALIQRAVCWKEKGDLDNAIKDFDEAIRLDRTDAVAFKYRGDAKSELKDYVAAIDDYDEAIRIEPTYAKAYGMRGNAKSNFKDYAAAIMDYDEFIRLDPPFEGAYRNRGMAKFALEDYAGAIKDCDEAIRLDPKIPSAYYIRGTAKANLDDFAAAIKDFDKTIRLDSKDAKAYVNRGMAKLMLNHMAAAIKDFYEVIRLDPENTNIRIRLSFLLSTAEDASLRNPDQALKLAADVLKEDSKNPYARNAKSCALAAKGDFKAAIAMQEGITDADWLKDQGFDGGAYAMARIADWKSGKLWHP